MQVVLQQRFAEGLLNFAFTRRRTLPAWETYHPHDCVDIRHDSLNDYWRLVSFDLLEQFRKCRFGFVLFFHRIDVLFGFENVVSQFEQLL